MTVTLLKLYCVFLASLVKSTYGYPTFMNKLPNGNNIPHPCKPGDVWPGVGHWNSGGGSKQLNPFGQDFKDNGLIWNKVLCEKDSDGDGKTNGEELGDPGCAWTGSGSPTGPATSHPGICEPPSSPICMQKNTVNVCNIVITTTTKPVTTTKASTSSTPGTHESTTRTIPQTSPQSKSTDTFTPTPAPSAVPTMTSSTKSPRNTSSPQLTGEPPVTTTGPGASSPSKKPSAEPTSGMKSTLGPRNTSSESPTPTGVQTIDPARINATGGSVVRVSLGSLLVIFVVLMLHLHI